MSRRDTTTPATTQGILSTLLILAVLATTLSAATIAGAAPTIAERPDTATIAEHPDDPALPERPVAQPDRERERLPILPKADARHDAYLHPSQANGLPIANNYTASGGCYVACYSNHQGVYQVGSFGVQGLVRVPGRYTERVCQPTGWEGKDISAASTFKGLCNRTFTEACDGGCWAGGDTGGFFGRPVPVL